MAAKAQWLTALQGHDPVRSPAAQDRVGKTALVHELLAFPERQFIAAAEVKHIAEIEIGQGVVKLWSQPRDSNGPKSVGVGAVQQVSGIGHRLRPCVGEEEGQALRGLLLKRGL